MGSLSSLYISQSYQSLAHLGTNNALVSGTMTQLQDGIGQSLNISFDGTNISSSGNIYGANITASVFNTGSLVTTASFNAYTQSNNQRVSSLETNSASVNTSISVLNTFTASQISFNNSATASIVALQNFSSSLDATFATDAELAAATASLISQINTKLNTSSFNAYTQSNDQRVSSLEVNSASVNTSISNINSTTASLNTSVSNLNTFTQSQQSFNSSATASISQLLSFSSSLDATFATDAELAAATASLITQINTKLNTSSFNSYTQSNDQRVNSLETTSASVNVSISNLNSTTSSFATSIANLNTTTASLNSSVSQLNASSASQQVSIDALNVFTASQSTASIVTSINNLNTFSASALVSISNINSTTASLNTSVSNLNSFTQSQEGVNTLLAGEIDSLQAKTGSYATTGSNNFIGDQNITGNISALSASFTYLQTIYESSSIIYSSGSNQFGDELSDVQTLSGSVRVQGSLTVNGTPVLTSSVDISGLVTTSSFNAYTQSNDQRVTSLEVNSASVNTSITNINSTTASLLIETNNLELFSASALISISNLNQSSASQQISIDNLNQKTGSYATTGSNVFTGDQTLIDTAANSVTLTNASGSLMLVAKGFTSSSLHLSASAAGTVNLIFKNNNNTADTIISASANIFINPAAPTAGFKRYMTGGNIGVGGSGAAVPQISGSMAFSPTVANNYFGVSATPFVVRGPVSSSAYSIINNTFSGGQVLFGGSATNNFEKAVSGLTFTANVINSSGVTINAYKTPLSASVQISNNNIGGTVALQMDSSSINLNGSIVQGSLTVNNSYFPSTYNASSAALGMAYGVYIGTNTIYASGSNTTLTSARTIQNTAVIGISNVLSASLNGDLSGVNSTILLGQSLNVIGSNSRATAQTAADWGSVFVGRWNDFSGNKGGTAETIFAVGTGRAAGTRKTGFLIDSGSNTYVEGSLNVSGSTSLTGSLTLNGNTITAVNTGSFATTGSNSFNGSQTITGSLIVSGSGAEARFPSFDTTAGRIKETLAFTGSRFASNLSMSIELENLNGTEFGFNQNAIGDGNTGAQFVLETNKDSGYTQLKLNARYTGSANAEFRIRNTAGVRTATIDADNSTFNGNVKVASTFQLQLPVGSNQQAGTAVLDGGNPGTVTVSNSLVTANSIIMLTKQTNDHPNSRAVNVSSKGAGTFTITSNHNGDTDTVGWFIINAS